MHDDRASRTRAIRRRMMVLGGVTLALIGATPAAGAAPAVLEDPRPYILDNGHIDLFELTYDQDASQLALQVKDDSELYDLGTVYRDPDTVTIALDTALWTMVIPEDLPPGYAFLGPAGTDLYVLDQVPPFDGRPMPWPGWSTERLGATLPPGIEVPFELGAVQFAVEVDGPGDVLTWMSDGDAAFNTYIDTRDDIPDVIPATSSSHTHTSWGFTAVGDYMLTVTPTATTTTGDTLSGPSQDYHFHVGDALVTPPVAPELTVTGGYPATYSPGDTVRLTAQHQQPTADHRFQWYRAIEDTAWEPIEGGDHSTLDIAAPPDFAQYLVLARDASGRIISTGYAYVDTVTTPPPTQGATQTIVAILDTDSAGLVVSVSPTDRDVSMSPFELASDATHWSSHGELRPITVIDTRVDRPGWTVSGQVSEFTSADLARLGPEHLGWTPRVDSQSDEQGVQASPIATSAVDGGPGLATNASLARAATGQGHGTAKISAILALKAPTDTAPGTYRGVVTLTVI